MRNYELRKQARLAREQSKWEKKKAKWDAEHASKPPILRREEAKRPIVIAEEPRVKAKEEKRLEEPNAEPEPVIKKPEPAEKGVKKIRKPAIKRSKKVARKSIREAIKGARIRENIVRLGSIKRKMPERLKRVGKLKIGKKRKRKIKPVKWEAARRSIKKLRKGVRIRENIARLGSVKKRIPGGSIKERIRGVANKERIRKLKSVKGAARKHIKRLAKRLKRR